MRNPLTTRGWIILGVAALILGLIGFGMVQTNRLRNIEAQARSGEFRQERIRIEREYIPAALDTKTADELSMMGGVLWGE